ncbi:MAG TPA: DUF5723 family protein [Balneolaceae bacterium]|nr:DUF5723 family protein [Balneolaceae bacterium]
MSTGKRFLILFSIGLILVGWGSAADAQSTHLTAKNLALGGGGTAYVDGYQANFINPANLMLGEGIEPRTTIGIIGGLSTGIGGPLANLNVYNQYFTSGLTIKGNIADEVLSKWFGNDPSKLKRVGMQTDFIPFGISYRTKNWAASLAVRSRFLMDAGVNRGVARLYLEGFTGDDFANGLPVNFSAEGLSFYEVSAGFSMKLLDIKSLGIAKNVKIYAGAAPKLLLGSNTTKLNFNSVLTIKGADQNSIDEIIHDFSYSFETNGEVSDQLKQFYQDRQKQQKTPDINNYVDPAGKDFYGLNATGVGLDLGGTMEMDLEVPVIGAFFKGPEHLTVGLSLTDLGSLSFNQEVGRFKASDVFDWKGFKFDKQEINQKYNGDTQEYVNHVLKDSIANNIYGSFTPQGISSLKRNLPTMVNVGGRLQLNKLSVSLDLMRGFNYEGTNSQRAAMSAGLEYNLFGFLPLRAGLRTGGYSSTSYSAGFGLEFRNFEFSVAASTVANSANNGSNVGAAWSGLVLKF